MATIGVFDGVHRGHRALLEIVLERALDRAALPLVITFDPHPVQVLAPEAPPGLLAPRRTKLRLLAELGIEAVWMLPFSRKLAAMPAESFVTDLLLARITPVELWIGYDFRFGRGRDGDPELLRSMGERAGFEVQQFGPVHESGRVLSSSWVREALGRGEMEEALAILGHTHTLEGPVVRGQGLGARDLVPTANLGLPPELCLPADGVYAGWAEVDGVCRPAVANIGVRPTVVRDGRRTVEVHLIDWKGDLQGANLAFHPDKRLRPERRFSGLEELRRAVGEDVAGARAWLRGRSPAFSPAPVFPPFPETSS